ncbi:hypothetical protein SK128_022107, partial [Halocaridina rubra]
MSHENHFPSFLSIISRKDLAIITAMNYRIQRALEFDLYGKLLDQRVSNATACLTAPFSITVNEPYNMQGLW